ncbi:MAG: cyclic nucleotide-binding domain-containing protein [Mariprofundaceae bacterium]|nr:cyclic nucleotide-binding domain-containing protein [Mariprofundaceae bacterium]
MSTDQLRNKAKRALLDGKYAKALLFFEELHKADPKDLRIYVKVAELREKTGDSKASVQDYIKIAKAYAEDSFVVQAIAINKIILRLDPNQTEVQKHLRELSSERGDDWAISTLKPQEHVLSEHETLGEMARLNVERTPLLSGLSGDEFESFMDSLTLKVFAAGAYIYKEGMAGDYLYLIGMGSVRLQAALPSGGNRVFSNLCEGDFFGEHAFMSRIKHVNAAVAETEASLLMINRETFDSWVKKHAKIKETVEEFYCQRVLARVLAITPIFEGVPKKVRLALADKFDVRIFNVGDVVVKEGDLGKSFFLIRSGRVVVFTNDMRRGGAPVELGVMGEGSFFVEVALLTDKPRTATVVAKDALEVMELTRDAFNAIALEYSSVRKVVEAYQKKRVQDTIKTLMKKGG